MCGTFAWIDAEMSSCDWDRDTTEFWISRFAGVLATCPTSAAPSNYGLESRLETVAQQVKRSQLLLVEQLALCTLLKPANEKFLIVTH